MREGASAVFPVFSEVLPAKVNIGRKESRLYEIIMDRQNRLPKFLRVFVDLAKKLILKLMVQLPSCLQGLIKSSWAATKSPPTPTFSKDVLRLRPLYDILLQRADNCQELFTLLFGYLEFFQGFSQMPCDDIEFFLGYSHSVVGILHIPT